MKTGIILVIFSICLLQTVLAEGAVNETKVPELDHVEVQKNWIKFVSEIANIDTKDANNFVLKNFLIQFYNNLSEKMTKGFVGRSVHMGCFQDHKYQRMFRGYSDIKIPQMTRTNCVSLCKNNNFAYAGAQSNNQCYCGDSAPVPEYNAPLGPSSCGRTCDGDKSTFCGGDWTSDVLTTGITITRQDETGNILSDSATHSARGWERK